MEETAFRPSSEPLHQEIDRFDDLAAMLGEVADEFRQYRAGDGGHELRDQDHFNIQDPESRIQVSGRARRSVRRQKRRYDPGVEMSEQVGLEVEQASVAVGAPIDIEPAHQNCRWVPSGNPCFSA
jgi:hypothetical protein